MHFVSSVRHTGSSTLMRRNHSVWHLSVCLYPPLFTRVQVNLEPSEFKIWRFKYQLMISVQIQIQIQFYSGKNQGIYKSND